MTPFAALMDLVLPSRCAGCRARPGGLCARCRPRGPSLHIGGGAVPTVAAAAYADALRAALLAYKERGRRDLAPALAELLAGAVTELLATRRPPPRPVLLVPVPSARSVAAARGGDHVLRLARRAAVRSGVRVAPGVLALTRSLRDSAGLGTAERAANLGHAMVAHPPPSTTVTAVVVDDIVTTGATLSEASRALVAAGWPVLGAAVSPPRRADRRRR